MFKFSNCNGNCKFCYALGEYYSYYYNYLFRKSDNVYCHPNKWWNYTVVQMANKWSKCRNQLSNFHNQLPFQWRPGDCDYDIKCELHHNINGYIQYHNNNNKLSYTFSFYYIKFYLDLFRQQCNVYCNTNKWRGCTFLSMANK